MDGLWWNTLLKWMIWGVPLFSETPICPPFGFFTLSFRRMILRCDFHRNLQRAAQRFPRAALRHFGLAQQQPGQMGDFSELLVGGFLKFKKSKNLAMGRCVYCKKALGKWGNIHHNLLFWFKLKALEMYSTSARKRWMKGHQLSLSTSLYHVVSNKGASYKEPHGNDLFLQLPKSSTSILSLSPIGLPKLRITTQPSPKIRQISHHHWMERMDFSLLITHKIRLGFSYRS